MHLRLAKESDLPTLARMMLTVFEDDPNCIYLWPYRQQYPEDYLRSLLHTVRNFYDDFRAVLLVVELDPLDLLTDKGRMYTDHTGGNLVSFGAWEKHGDEAEARVREASSVMFGGE